MTSYHWELVSYPDSAHWQILLGKEAIVQCSVRAYDREDVAAAEALEAFYRFPYIKEWGLSCRLVERNTDENTVKARLLRTTATEELALQTITTL